MNKQPPYIIIQASGRGIRLKQQTNNKPKALVSFLGEPIIIRTMKAYKGSFFIIIGSYKFNVLRKYLNKYSPTNKYKLIKTKSCFSGSASGIKKALELIPPSTPFMITWCDLYYFKPINFKTINLKKTNYIGISRNFTCRWRFYKGILEERRSKKHGVTGIFIFKRKDQIEDLPDEGEFCKYLRNKRIKFLQLKLDNLTEIGTIRKYFSLLNKYPAYRPFNTVIIKDNVVIKKPKNNQGKDLAMLERNWYKYFSRLKLDFLPATLSYKPLIIERINGQPLFKYQLKTKEKQELLEVIIKNLQKIHFSTPPKKGNFYENNYQAYLLKTKQRLDSIIDIIPFSRNKYININKKRCFNFYLKWKNVEETAKKYFSNTYRPIHGDCTLSNILYDREKQKIYFIDPRGYFGREKIYGDVDYDWAKLYYSIYGDYDQFNTKKFTLDIEKNNISLKIKSNGYKKLIESFFKLTKADKQKVAFIHCLIWLSLTSYCFDDYDAICAAFYRGIYLLNRVTENNEN